MENKKNETFQKTLIEEFVNPITGEKENVDITVEATQEQIDKMTEIGIDAIPFFDSKLKELIEENKQEKYFESIKEYASSSDVVEKDVYYDEYPKMCDNIWGTMIDYIKTIKEPVAYADSMAHCILRSHGNYNTEGHDSYHFKFCKFNIDFDVETEESKETRRLEVYQNITMFNEYPTKVLIYDKNEPQNCRLFEFTPTY